MCGNMVDIQYVTTKNRQRKKEETRTAKYNVRICYAGQP